MTYLVVLCPRCGEPRYVRSSRKSMYCFRCGAVRDLERVRRIREVANVMEAVYLVQQLKLRRGSRGGGA